jgi:hypothetical protein
VPTRQNTPVNVSTYHNNTVRSGLYWNEAILPLSKVKVGICGKPLSLWVDGYIRFDSPIPRCRTDQTAFLCKGLAGWSTVFPPAPGLQLPKSGFKSLSRL